MPQEIDKNLPTYYISGPRNDDVRRMFNRRHWRRVDNEWEAQFIVYTGGPDINPFLYGEYRHPKTHPNMVRDLEDMTTLQNVLYDEDKVHLGICRGAQFLNVVLGHGSMWQDVNNHLGPHSVKDKSGNTFIVSSTHHQLMVPGRTGEVLLDCDVSSRREGPRGRFIEKGDKTWSDPECVLYQDRKALCFQPHPEFQFSSNLDCQNWFFDTISCYFLDKAQEDALNKRRLETSRSKKG